MSNNSLGDAMANRKISIDWETLETAVERNSSTMESFLDTNSGQVLTISEGDPEEAQNRAEIANNIAHYIRVEPASSREQYRWMERFVTSVVDVALRKRLAISIDGKGAFRRFKDVLLAYPAERERWFAYRCDLLHWHIQNWLSHHELEASNEAPWGPVNEPEELETVEAEQQMPLNSPGESLRRQARELIDSIAPIELASAIAFLEFLQERGLTGSAALSQQTADLDTANDAFANDDETIAAETTPEKVAPVAQIAQ